MKSDWCFVVLVVIIVVLASPSAGAQTGSSEWQFAIAPYLWAAGMDGTLTVGEMEQDIDYPFSDVLSDLDFALMGHFDMRNERWVISSDLVSVDLGRSQEVDPIEPGDPITVRAGIDMLLAAAEDIEVKTPEPWGPVKRA